MMNATEFCKVLGINTSTYSMIESNKQQGNIETMKAALPEEEKPSWSARIKEAFVGREKS